jgi:hypothetical protein
MKRAALEAHVIAPGETRVIMSFRHSMQNASAIHLSAHFNHILEVKRVIAAKQQSSVGPCSAAIEPHQRHHHEFEPGEIEDVTCNQTHRQLTVSRSRRLSAQKNENGRLTNICT